MKSDAIVFQLDNSAGFFSVFWFLCLTFIYAKKTQKDFYISHDNWQYTYQNGWHDYFDSLSLWNTNLISKYKSIQCIRHWQIGNIPRRFTVEDYINAVQTIFAPKAFIFLKAQEEMAKLGEMYNSVYIRRGDKIRENSFTPTCDIVSQLCLLEGKTNNNPIFLMTDDYAEFEFINSLIKHRKIVTLCSPGVKGSFYEDHSKLSKLKIKEHTIELLVSCIIFSKGVYKLADENSNVGRFLFAYSYLNCSLYPEQNKPKMQDLFFPLIPSRAFHHINTWTSRPAPSNIMYMGNVLCLVAIFKDESHIMQEWIEHYIKEGVQKFFLIDNGSKDQYLHILAPYIKDHIVELVVNPTKDRQNAHCNYYLEKCKEYEWVLVCDLNEFVYARNMFKTIPEYLNTINEATLQILLPRKLFGSSGHIKQSEKVIPNFTLRESYKEPISKEIKTITRTKAISRLDIHRSHLINKQMKHDDFFVKVEENWLNEWPLHLNHYRVQCLEWSDNVKGTRDHPLDKNGDVIFNSNYFRVENKNETHDSELKIKRAI